MAVLMTRVRALKRPGLSVLGRLGITCSVALLMLATPLSPSHAADQAYSQAAKKCGPNSPGLAVTVGWRMQDENWLVMTPHVQVANCKRRIKYVRILLQSFNNGFLTERRTEGMGTYPSKYGNTSMTVHWPNYLPVKYEVGQSGRYVGVGFAPVRPEGDEKNVRKNQRPYELTSCTRRVDGLEVDTSGVTFTVNVWPLDGKRRIIKDIGAAALGPFTCLQPDVSTAP